MTVWIGELQWRIEHGYEFKTNPVLERLDHIECRDALLSFVAGVGTGSGARAGGRWRWDGRYRSRVAQSQRGDWESAVFG